MNNLIIPTLIVSCLALFAGLTALVLTLGQMWSTHKIEWRPLQFDKLEEEADKELEDLDRKDEEILEKALELQRRGKRPQDPLEEITQTVNF